MLLLSVPLPKMSAAQRQASAAFAVEDQIARPLDEVRVALGPELEPGRWLVAVVALSALPVEPGRWLPDTLALPVPPLGAWAVLETLGRILVRLPDGTGLVTRSQALPVLHHIAGGPRITLYGGQIALAHQDAALPPMQLPGRLDLGQARGAIRLPRLARQLAAVLALTLLGHLGILGTNLVSLSRHQAALEAALRQAAQADPALGLDALLARILAPGPVTAEAGFLPLISASFAAMAPEAGAITLRDLRYKDSSLTLTLQAADLGTLQQVESDLALAGLAVSAGPATSTEGAAEQQMTLQGPPP